MRRWIRIGSGSAMAALSLLLVLWAGTAWAEISIQAAVDQDEVYVGQTFTLQVQVEGNDSPGEPDLTPLVDFTVEPRGGQQNSSESVSIVNGRMSRVSHHGYVFNYGLTPKRAGRLVIPSLAVVIDKQTYRTQPVRIQVKQPEESDDFKLRLTLGKERAYAGEPVPITVTWYIGKDVNGFTFNLPFLSDPRFTITGGDEAKGPAQGQKQGNLIRIPAPGGDIVAEKGNGVLDGENYLTVSFARTLIAKEPGQITLPQATVSCQAVSGYRQGGGRDPFSGMLPDDFFGRSRQVLRTVVVPSNQPVLEVLPLPAEGRPADFSGLVGEYSLAVTASPTKVKVGDPITLTVQVAGPSVAGAALPSLAEGLGLNDFKVPEEMAPGEGSAVLKTFTQTIRVRHSGVRQIPSLRLTFFNPASGRYDSAVSQPVPLEVAESRVVTAQDAEGATAVGPEKKAIETVQDGISYNYEGTEVLAVQVPVGAAAISGWWLVILLLPPGVFSLILAGTLLIRYGRKDPAGRAARQAQRQFQAAVAEIGNGVGPVVFFEALGLALREYLGAKLRRNPAALTYGDVEPQLAGLGAGPDLLTRLRQVMEQCEAWQYAGAGAYGDTSQLREMAVRVVDELEPFLNKGGL